MRLIRLLWKGSWLIGHLAAGGAKAAFDAGNVDEFYMRQWCRKACSILRLRVRIHGAPLSGAVLYAANHISWLEVVAMGSVVPAGFVAKDDVARWPVIGPLASAAGTLFLRRGSARAASRTAEAAVVRLAAGRGVAVFPEGTSTTGESVLPFKASIFEAAARLGCDVQPVAVRYPSGRGRSRVAPFVGDDDFFTHLLHVLSEREIAVDLLFCAAQSAHGRGREELATTSRDAVVTGLDLLARGAGAGNPTISQRHEYPHRHPFGSGHTRGLALDADRGFAAIS